MKSAFLPLALLLVLVPASAQSSRPTLETIRTQVDSARAAARAGNIAAAEEALVALNRARPETAAWHIESAQRLLQTAEQLAREGQPQNVAPLSIRALQHVAQAIGLARDKKMLATANTMAGFILERYLANPEGALRHYDDAIRLAPDDSDNAAEAATRVRKTSDGVREKIAEISR